MEKETANAAFAFTIHRRGAEDAEWDEHGAVVRVLFPALLCALSVSAVNTPDQEQTGVEPATGAC